MSSPKVNINFWKIFAVIVALEEQLTEALKDDKITMQEAMNMVKTICEVLEINVTI